MALDEKEVESWRLLKIYQAHGGSKGRYRAEVRHPLKPRRLDEKELVFGTHYMPHARLNPHKTSVSVGKCGTCGEEVEAVGSHPCFSGRVMPRKARG